MTAAQPTAAPPACPEPFRWPRSTATSLLDQARLSDLPSERARAAEHDLPPSTLRYWRQRLDRLDAPKPLRDFFESPAGLDFLKDLVLAAHLCFQQSGAVGVRPLLTFFEHAGLRPFLACSFGPHQRLAARLRELLLAYDQEQRQALASGMPARHISLCEDETFHRLLCCLVGIEPCSNFILLESYQPKRDQATWDRVVAAALEGLPVEVDQVCSDEAKALLAHAKHSLGAVHSPDLMHVQQGLHRATSLPLRKRVEQAQQQVQHSFGRLAEQALAKAAWELGKRPPGRRPDFEARLLPLRQQYHEAQQGLADSQQRQQQVPQAIRGLSDDYHPFDSQSGTPVTAQALQERLAQRLEVVEQAAVAAGLGENSHKEIAKVRRVLPQLVATLAWFWVRVREMVAVAGWTAEQGELLRQRVLGWAYWEQASRRGRTAKDRQRLRELAGRLWEAVQQSAEWQGLSEAQRQRMKEQAHECAGRWVRSSSCVEGRNGVLRLRRHGKQGLSQKELGALTVLHNYWIKRPDGTTAAQRFFGQKPADLFKWLRGRFPELPRPAQSRRKTA